MKKLTRLIVLLVIFVMCLGILTACNNKNNSADTRNLDYFTKAFESDGYTLQNSGEPLYSLIGAIDGIIFYVNNDVFKIYQYENEAAYQKAYKDFPIVQNMVKNGLFVAESSSNELLEFFKGIPFTQSKH